MPSHPQTERLLRRAVAEADDTRAVEIGAGAIETVPSVFESMFGPRPAVIVADAKTWNVAGERTLGLLLHSGIQASEPIVLDDPDLHATYEAVTRVKSGLESVDSIPVAVGSGTINDLAKRAAHEVGRPYMVVATAASMDGYTAFGASINYRGAKQTMFCPAPTAVVADSQILATAPPEMNAAGYADLAAKIVSGADWILSDALEIEPIHEAAWSLTQPLLQDWLADPKGVCEGDPSALGALAEGLLMTGFGMQATKSSRPASGAEHQFSHLWDMQHHTFEGRIPFHGYKVGIGTLCSARFYECLLQTDVESLDIEAICDDWPSWEWIESGIDTTHASEELRRTARTELREKYVDREALAERLRLLKRVWPDLRSRLNEQLLPVSTLQNMLREAGAPTASEEIGIDRARLRESFAQAQQIRRRFTILDVARQTGLFGDWLEKVFEKNNA